MDFQYKAGHIPVHVTCSQYLSNDLKNEALPCSRQGISAQVWQCIRELELINGGCLLPNYNQYKGEVKHGQQNTHEISSGL